MRSTLRRLAPIAALVVGLTGTPASTLAGHGPFTLGAPVLVSGPSPFAACPIGAADASSVNYVNTEVEPFVAVNPTNPDNIIGVYQQDRWNDGGAHGTAAASSSNGGSSWTRNFAAFSECSGGDPRYDRATDPWVSFDADGRAYQNALSIDSAALNVSANLVSTSTNGGATWGTPVVVIEDQNPINFNDKNSITADWTRGGYAYATWIRGNLPGENISPSKLNHAFSFRGTPMISRTTDGGATWSTPAGMTNANLYAQGNQIVVLPDGTLLDVFAVLFQGSGVQPNPNHSYIGVMRSKDAGRTWSRPTKVADLGTVLLTNPDVPNPTTFEETVRAGDFIPDIAVDKDSGEVYIVWADGQGTAVNHVVLSKSSDGGKQWTAPQKIGTTPAADHSFNGTVEVTDDGTVAVMYYDFRGNTPASGLPTDIWLAHSNDGAATWSEQHVTGPFDMTAAPNARGWFLGDYQGLAAAGDDLLLFYSTTQGDSANVYAVRAN